MQNTLHVLLFVIPVFVFGQDSFKNWKSFPASASVEQLEAFKALYIQNEALDWPDDERIAFLKKGLSAAEKLGADDEAIFFSQTLGNRYHMLDSFGLAIQYLNYPIELALDTLTIARSYNRLGYLYFDVGDYTNALRHFFEAVRYGKMLNNGWETYPFGNITHVYKQLEDYENAIKYTKASIVIDKKAGFPDREYGLVFNYTNLLLFHQKKKEYDSCKYYIRLIEQNIVPIDTIDNRNYNSAIHYSHIVIAEYFLETGALALARKHLDLAGLKSLPEPSAGLLMLKGRFWIKLREFSKALEIITSLEELDLHNFGDVENLLELKIDYYKALEDFETVATIQEELLANQREKYSNDRWRYSAFADAEFENREQQSTIRSLENQQKLERLKKRNRTYILVIIILVVMGTAGFFGYRYRQNQRRNEYLDHLVHLKTKDLEKANFELRTLNHIASHDIKEPIRNIGNYAGLIYHRLPEAQKTQFEPYFSIIRQGTRQLYTLLEDLAQYLSLSREKEVQLEAVDLNELVNNLILNIDAYVRQVNGKIEFNQLPVVASNTSLMFVILKNLIENGLKFNTSIQPTIEINCQETNSSHDIVVKDNGIGIAPEYIEEVFQMFSRLHSRGDFEGNGLGLAIVKMLCDKMDIKVKIKSEVGRGSIITLQLPKR